MTGFTEDELIDALRTILAGDIPSVRVGPGDDAAVVDGGSELEILTTDLLVEGVHFDEKQVAPRDLGYKSLAVSVSDVAAMGGRPRYALVALAIPARIQMPWVVELYGGLREAAAEYGAAVVGGDTSASERIVISVMLTGEVAKNRAVTRTGARPGDRVVVTGHLGAAAGGLWLAQAGAGDEEGVLGTDWARALLGAHARPTARVEEGQMLAAAGATAMMDISDGLAKDLGRLCRESEVGATVDLSAIPVAPALEELKPVLEVDPLDLALGGGEDYELLATLPPEAVERTTSRVRERLDTPLTDIGEITEGEGLKAKDANGGERPLEPEGWDHFGA